jgi:hypothetical protein
LLTDRRDRSVNGRPKVALGILLSAKEVQRVSKKAIGKRDHAVVASVDREARKPLGGQLRGANFT